MGAGLSISFFLVFLVYREHLPLLVRGVLLSGCECEVAKNAEERSLGRVDRVFDALVLLLLNEQRQTLERGENDHPQVSPLVPMRLHQHHGVEGFKDLPRLGLDRPHHGLGIVEEVAELVDGVTHCCSERFR